MTGSIQRFTGTLLLIAVLLTSGVAGAAPTARAAQGTHFITGTFATTNPIYPLLGADIGAILYDLAGLITQDYAFVPPPEAQVIGTLSGDIRDGSYELTLPDAPLGMPLDLDGDAATPAVQVFATGVYIDFLGDVHVNRGETLLNASVTFAPFTQAIAGGRAVVWAAVDGAPFPSGPGADGVLFTDDDPQLALPAGWSVIDLDAAPFAVLRDETIEVPVLESTGALNDYSGLSYGDAWEQFFARVRETYPFTDDKALDWDAIYDEITPLIAQTEDILTFHLVIAQFGELLRDTHVGYSSVPVVSTLLIGGIGISDLRLTDADELVVMGVSSGSPAAQAGIAVGDVLLEVDGLPAVDAVDDAPLLLNSASTAHNRRYFQTATLLQGPVGSTVALTWQGAAGAPQSASFTRVMDASALLAAFDTRGGPGRVVQSQLLPSGVGYISVRGFAEEVSAAEPLFRQALQDLMDAGAAGIVVDIRDNSGGLVNLAMAMAGHFFPDYERVIDFYYADGMGDFVYRGFVETLAGEPYYDGPVAVLVNEMTGSAGDMFAYALQHDGRAIIVGHSPSGGFTGEVSDGQYLLPGQLTVQVPTGRPTNPLTGETVIEGVGVAPDVRVPLTVEALLSPGDEVLQAAEAALLEIAGR